MLLAPSTIGSYAESIPSKWVPAKMEDPFEVFQALAMASRAAICISEGATTARHACVSP